MSNPNIVPCGIGCNPPSFCEHCEGEGKPATQALQHLETIGEQYFRTGKNFRKTEPTIVQTGGVIVPDWSGLQGHSQVIYSDGSEIRVYEDRLEAALQEAHTPCR